jgi:predicted nucleic acid-binding protein
VPVVILDTNLLVLLMVGRTDRSYVGAHRRTQDYDTGDLDIVELLISAYDGIATTPPILTEASNLLRQIRNPARDLIQQTLRTFNLAVAEHPITSESGYLHAAYIALGLTDAVVLAACETVGLDDRAIELLTADEPLYNRALSLGLPAELYA